MKSLIQTFRACLFGLPVLLLLLPTSFRGMGITVFVWLLGFTVYGLLIMRKVESTRKPGAVISIASSAVSILLTIRFYMQWQPSSMVNSIASKVNLSSDEFLFILGAVLCILSAVTLSKLLACFDSLNSINLNLVAVHDLFRSKQFKISIIVAFFTAVVCYFEYLKNGHGSPDTLIEGLLLYRNFVQANSSGRWIAAINLLNANVVNPVLSVIICTVLQAISSALIVKMCGIERRIETMLVTISIVAAPAIASQYLYIHMAGLYGIALLASTLSAYWTIQYGDLIHYFLAALALSVSLGCYQSYIGFTAGLIICTLMLNLLKYCSFRDIVKKASCCIAMGISGVIIYVVIWKVFFWGIPTSYSGADQIGLLTTLRNLLPSIKNAYCDFWNYYTDAVAYRNIAFIVVLLICFALLMYSIVGMWKKSKKMALLLIALSIVVPIVFNIIDLIAVERTVNEIMNHQMQLIIPFMFSLLNIVIVPGIITKYAKRIGIVAVACICVICEIRAFSTYKSIDMSYRYVSQIAESALQMVKNGGTTRVLFVGRPDETKMQEGNPLYQYSYYKYDSAVFWDDTHNLRIWRQFIWSTFGFDVGEFNEDEFNEVINSDDYKIMSVYPNENSIIEYEDFYVIKMMDYLDY